MIDSRKDRFLEQMDDAGLALLMDEYSEADGANIWQAFDEAQASGSVPEIPEQIDAKCNQLIQRSFVRQARIHILHRAGKIAASTAASLLLVFGALSAVIMSVDALRLPVLNYLYAQTEIGSHLFFEGENAADYPTAGTLISLLDTLLPDEYQLDTTLDDTNGSICLGYQGDHDHYFSLDVVPARGAFSFDSENAEITETLIGSHKAFFVEKEGFSLIWINAETELIYNIFAKGLDEATFWNIANALAQ